jgi:ubiquinone biosynthesis protein Coq4
MKRLITQWRSAILVFLTHRMALPLLRLLRREEKFPYRLEELAQLPEHTLGKALHDFLQERELALLPYYARHDMKHILLEYPTTDEGEGCLQYFMLGNGHVSFPVLATVLYCGITMPAHWKVFRKAYQRGKTAQSLAGWDWFAVVHKPVTQLQQQIFTA